MTEAEWQESASVPEMLGSVPPLSYRKQLLYGCACCRWVWAELAAQRRFAVEVVEEYADGRVSLDDVRSAADVAQVAPSIEGEDWASLLLVRKVLRLPLSEICNLTTSLISVFASNTPAEEKAQAATMRCVSGNPFRPVTFSPQWRTDTAIALARTMYDSREFGAMPILADALQDAECDNDNILSHCRSGGTHVRGCWVVDLVLGKE